MSAEECTEEKSDERSGPPEWLGRVIFRPANPRDIPACYELEIASYPPDEAASRSTLQYRQHHAAPYFRCAVLDDKTVGFICSTRCREFDHDSMSVHDSMGSLLAIHSVVVEEKYRHVGLATMMMKDYIAETKGRNDGVEKLVLIAKSDLLGFYVNCGFSVIKPSEIVHGSERWYDVEMDIRMDKSRLKGHPYWVVDSFADAKIPGSGNPAAVVVLPRDFDSESEETLHWMQVVGREFNLSETAFVWPREEYGSDEEMETQEFHFNVRYITCNGTEVDLCGHATLASAAILLQTLPFKIKNDVAIVFHAKKDLLSTRPYVEGNKTWSRLGQALKVTMDFPKKTVHDITAPADRSALLGMLRKALNMSDTAENIIFLGVDEDHGDCLVHLTCESFLQLGFDDINFKAMMEWDGYSRGVILCCRSNQALDANGDEERPDEEAAVDFFSRFFGPKAGINEDPVTGSAYCTLAPYFGAKLGKNHVVGKQMSRRGGIVECELKDDRVSIVGTAVTAMSGSLSM